MSMLQKKDVQRAFGAMHRGVFRLTRGRIGGRFGKAPILLLTTTGRRSGKARTTPVIYVRDGAAWVVAASNGGRDDHPAWYVNLLANPSVTVDAGSTRTAATASAVAPEERARLWAALVAIYRQYEDYRKATEREIPLVRLMPA